MVSKKIFILIVQGLHNKICVDKKNLSLRILHLYLVSENLFLLDKFLNINFELLFRINFKMWSIAEDFDFENLFYLIELKFYLKFLFVTN